MAGLNQELGQHALPNMGPLVTADAVEVRTDPLHFVTRGVRIDSAVDDPRTGATSGLLKAGLVLVRAEAGGAAGKYVEFSHADAPIVAAIEKTGILLHDVNTNLRGSPGSFVDKSVAILIHGFVDEALIEFDTAVAAEITGLKGGMALVQFEDTV